MRNVPIDEVDDLDRDVVAISTGYPAGTRLATHRHRRAQLLYSPTGPMRVRAGEGDQILPPSRAVLIPPATDHAVTMAAAVTTRSLYVEPAAVPWFPRHCQVIDVPPLLRELLAAAIEVEPRYRPAGRDTTLLSLVLHELSRTTPPAPSRVDAPLPADPELRALCQAFLARPRIDVDWPRGLHVSVRTLQRRFVAQTGLTPAAWRRRACVRHARIRLAAGIPVTRIAADLGYATPSAFTAMFTAVLGAPPTTFRPVR